MKPINSTKRLRKLTVISLAVVLILVGLVVLPLPIPFGAPMIAVGIVMLVAVSRRAAHVVKGIRRRIPRLDAVITAAETRLPLRFARILQMTSPVRPPRKPRGERSERVLDDGVDDRDDLATQPQPKSAPVELRRD